MIRLAVVDAQVKGSENTFHRIEREGKVLTVRTEKFSEKTLNPKGDDEDLVTVFNVRLSGDEGKELLNRIDANHAKVCLYITNDDDHDDTNGKFDGVLASIDWIFLNSKDRNTLVEELSKALDLGERISPKLVCRIIKFITQPEFKRWDNSTALSTREIELMNLVVEGTPDKEISKKLGITLNTVRSHLKKIFSKFGVNNRLEAMVVYTKYCTPANEDATG
jgi:DNA-binding NarL/FixJ family response regulator